MGSKLVRSARRHRTPTLHPPFPRFAHSLCSHFFSPNLQENERTKDLIVEQKFHRTIIGQKGEKIKEVRDKFPEVSALPASLSHPAIPVKLSS